MKNHALAFVSVTLCSIQMVACGPSTSSSPSVGAGDWSGFELTTIDGTETQHAVKYDGSKFG